MSWGINTFGGGTWLAGQPGGDTVYPFEPGSGGSTAEEPLVRNAFVTAGPRLLSDGVKTARGLVSRAVYLSPYGWGDQIADNLYQAGSHSMGGGIVHVPADPYDTTTVVAEFRLRHDAQKIGPLYEDPSDYYDPIFATVGSSNDGSDILDIRLDSALDYSHADTTDVAVVNYDAEPQLSQAHNNHSIVWPFRVRSDRSVVPSNRIAGFTQLDMDEWTPLCESRIFKFTDTNNVTRNCLYLVWYPTTDASAAVSDMSVFSSDYIVISAYDATTGVPHYGEESPFFSNGVTGATFYEVRVNVAASLNGFVSMRAERVLDGYAETIAVTGQTLEQFGGFSGTGHPVGITHLDIGMVQASPHPQNSARFPNEGTDCGMSWEMDDLAGDDVSFTGGGTGTTLVWGETFSQISDQESPYCLPASLYPRGRQPGDGMRIIQDASFPMYPAGIANLGSNAHNVTQSARKYSSAATIQQTQDYELPQTPATFTMGDTFTVSGEHRPIHQRQVDQWVASPVAVGHGVQVTSTAGSRVVLSNFTDPGSGDSYASLLYPWPNEGLVVAGHERRFGYGMRSNDTSLLPQVHGLRFTDFGADSNAANLYDYPLGGWVDANGGDSTDYEWFLRLPAFTIAPSSAGNRSLQTEMMLFYDGTPNTSPTATDMPDGIGISWRFSGTLQAYLFIKGSTGADTVAGGHAIVGLVVTNPARLADIALSTKESGGTITIECYANGRKFGTASGDPTSDHTIATSAIPGGWTRGIGVQGCVRTDDTPSMLIGDLATPSGLAFGHGRLYGGLFQARYDSTQTGYSQADFLDGSIEHEHDFVVEADAGFSSAGAPSYFYSPRMRAAWKTSAELPNAERTPFRLFSLQEPDSGTPSSPFPNLSGQLLRFHADFPLGLDSLLSGSQTDGMVIYRTISMYCDPEDWVDYQTVPGDLLTITTPPRTGFIPKGVTLLIWGNTNDGDGTNNIARPYAQLIVIEDGGTIHETTPQQMIPTGGAVGNLNNTLYRAELKQDSDEVFSYKVTEGGGTLEWTDTLDVTGSTVTGTELALGRYYEDRDTANEPINDTWLTGFEIHTDSVSSTTPSEFDTHATIGAGAVQNTVVDVHGRINDQLIKRILDVRGTMDSGGGSDQEISAVARHLMVFDRDGEGDLPGSVNHDNGLGDTDHNWYLIGSAVSAGVAFWGGPSIRYTAQDLLDHEIHIEKITHSANGESSMTIRQDSITPFGGHLRVGQMVVYVEQTGGAFYEYDATNGLSYGTGAPKIMFRGEVQTINRNNGRSSITYTAVGPIPMLEDMDIQDLTDCRLGQIAFNVEPGSPNTPYAVSKNLDYSRSLTPQFSPENYGDMLGMGIPDLNGMTLADMIEYVINLFRVQLNSKGLLRLPTSGDLIIANDDGSAIEFHEDSPLNTDDNTITGTVSNGPKVFASVIWAPNREAFSIIPTETVVKGALANIFRGFMSNLPDARWRIEPTHMQWIFETKESLLGTVVDVDDPGVSVNITDDGSNVYTSALYSSPWQAQEEFLFSLKGGTLQPAWLPVDESQWMGPFSQIGFFLGEVVEASNFPFSWPGTEGATPVHTVLKFKVDAGEEPLSVSAFDGITLRVTSGPVAGYQGIVINSNQSGGFTPPYQFFEAVVEPAMPGGFGAGENGVEINIGDTIVINDDPMESTTESSAAYSKVWADFIMIDKDSGTPVNNLVNGGFFQSTGHVGGCDPHNQLGGGVFQTLPVNSVVSNGDVVTSPVPLSFGAGVCGPGSASSPLQCGGEIVYRGIRVQEGTWCARSPESGYSGTAYSDVVEFEGLVGAVDNDGRGFTVIGAVFTEKEWAPRAGAFARITIVGGQAVTFDLRDEDGTNGQDINTPVTAVMDGGFDHGGNDPWEAKSILGTVSSNLGGWHTLTSADNWINSTGVIFKQLSGSYGEMAGAFVTRFIPGKYSGTHDFLPLTDPLNIARSSLNNHFEITAKFVVDRTTHTVSSLSQVGLIARAENGFMSDRDVPQNDVGGTDPWLVDYVVDIDTEPVSSTAYPNFTTAQQVGHLVSEANQLANTGISQDVRHADMIPGWISSTFADGDTPTVTAGTGSKHNGESVLNTDGVVIDARPFIPGNPTDISSTYDNSSSDWSTAQRESKMGLEYGTTGYVFRMVRGDDPDYLFAGGNSNAVYPTLFWYHTRRAMDGNNTVLDDSGNPVYEGVKEIIYQTPQAFLQASDISGNDQVDMRMSIESPIPLGLSHRIFVTVTTGNTAFSIVRTHDPSKILLSNGNYDEFGHYQYRMSGFDGVYATAREGFSLVRGGGGFGYGFVKNVQALRNGSQAFDTSKPAKLTGWQLRRINRPEYGYEGEDLDLVEAQFDDAAVGLVTDNSFNKIRFSLTHGSLDNSVPRQGDRFRLQMERGWKIAKQKTFTVSGLDNPNKIWIFKHMADSALRAANSRAYSGTIELPGTRYEMLDAGRSLSIRSGSYHTGLEDANQPINTVTYTFEGDRERKTEIGLATSSNVFSRIDALLDEAAQAQGFFQTPSFLGPQAELARQVEKQQAAMGINKTGAAGFGYPQQQQQFCGGNIFVDNPGFGFQNLTDLNAALNNWLNQIQILIFANKGGPGGDEELTYGSGVEGGGLVLENSEIAQRLLAAAVARGVSQSGGLMDDTFVFSDSVDGQLYSPYFQRTTQGAGYDIAWAAVRPVRNQNGRYELDTDNVGKKPRESGTTIDTSTVSGGTNSYVISSRFVHPVVQVIAASGYSGGTATEGDHLSADLVPGFKITESGLDVTISATGNFGPCNVYLSS